MVQLSKQHHSNLCYLAKNKNVKNYEMSYLSEKVESFQGIRKGLIFREYTRRRPGKHHHMINPSSAALLVMIRRIEPEKYESP